MIKEKLINIMTAHPKLVTFGIGFAITFAIALTADGLSIGSAQALLHSGPVCVKC